MAILFAMAAALQAQSIAPASVTLKASKTQLFSVQKAGTNRYSWSISPSLGSITAAGLYTAPSSITTVSTVTIFAIDPGYPSLSATVTLMPSVSIAISPTWISMTNGQSAPFNASVTGTTNTGVEWSSPAVGSITSGGVYTVPMTLTSQQTITLTVTSVLDPTKTATATIALIPTIAVTLNPTSKSLTAGQSTALNATVTGTTNTGLNWSFSPQVGTLSNGVYTAPSSISSAQTVTVTAISQASAGTSASVTLSLVPAVSIAVTPTTASLTSSQSATFKASVSGTSNTAVNWTVTPAVGTVTNGVYTAPALVTSAQSVTVKATSAADSTKSASATVSLTPSVSIGMTPTTASLTGGQSTTLTATVSGSSNTSVNWSMSPSVGTLSNGVYRAPATIASAQTVTVTAASAADPTKTVSAKITLVPVSITISPTTASLTGGQSSTLKATVSGSSNTSVNWSISPSVGTIVGGVYTAPATIASAQTVTVKASSAADPTKTASAAISLLAAAPVVSISVTPSSASLTGGQSTTLKATVSGSSNTGVNWSISPSVGTIAGGVYTAPATIASAQTVTVKATSAADATKSSSAAITLTPVAITVSPSTASLAGGQSATLKATVSGSSNTSVSWSMSPSVGTIAGGVYTAPATIASAQTVTVKATSAADPTKTASAAISLVATPVVSISVTPSSASLTGGQSATFKATVSGTSNLGVNWTVTPPVGTITNGVYAAPALISLQQTVTVAAASAADPTKIASVAITLVPAVSVAVSPATATLAPSQSIQFSASLSGTTNPNVTWAMSPNVGSLSNGLYQAPATINSQQIVTVTATSAADSTKTSSATITLVPTVGIALTPSSISLTGGQSTQFNVTNAGAPASASTVTWTLVPPVGNITNGVYSAPVTISSLQTIVLTVASIANPTQTATANITLTASTAPATSVSPSLAALAPSQTQQFTATGLGTNPKWTISPTTGSITSGGLYSAPSSVTSQTTITVTATNATDSSQAATATVTLNPAATQSPTAITLPVEVMGVGTAATQVPVSFNIPSGSNLNGQVQLWLQIHGLKFQTEASVQLNGGAWLPINDSTVTLQGLGAQFGGIGGGFATLVLTMTLPTGSIQQGQNTLTFQFNGTDGITSGFRVLNLNILDPSGNQLIAASNFTQDDPSTWQIPLNDPTDIAAGKTLWSSANLTVPGTGAIQAKCGMCHTQDGRDLKYFNYSNLSIQSRAMFHGLTAQQGNQIASYIRSLNTPAPATARPWNPPYQPGPGTDSLPISDWAAGAGLAGVLDHDSDMLPYLMPGGSTADLTSTAHLNARETPIPLQLPDWNHYLPTIHPVDAFGSEWTSSALYQNYLNIRATLVPNDPASFAAALKADYFAYWLTYDWDFRSKVELPASSAQWQNPIYIRQFYSYRIWSMVKQWELNQEFGLESMARVAFGPGPKTASRAWFSNMPFMASPFMANIPRPSPGLANGTIMAHVYFSFAWYHLQLILNDGNGIAQGTYPIDWAYSLSYLYNALTWNGTGSYTGTAGLMLEWLAKGLQSGNFVDTTPQVMTRTPAEVSTFSELSPSQKLQVLTIWTTIWLQDFQQYKLPQINRLNSAGTVARLQSNISEALPVLRDLGVSPTLLNQVVQAVSLVWPTVNWTSVLNQTCTVGTFGMVSCQ